MAIVFGFVRNETGGPAIGARVRVFDKDLRHEQLLGDVVITESTGRYEITYTSDQFRRAEKKTADLIVRAFDQDGNQRAESDVHYNAPDSAQINLTFGPVPVLFIPPLSELEALQQAIAPVQEDVPCRNFTDQDLEFFFQEIKREGSLGEAERRTVRQRLEFLRLADQFTARTAIPLAAFYGWFREEQPQVLAELLAVPVRTLQASLVAAIRDRIIPDITAEIPAILERVRSLRFEQGLVLTHRFVVQFVNAATDRPLVGFRVAVTDPAAEPEDRDLGVLFTDGQGACVILFSLPANPPASAIRRLHLQLSDDGTDVAETTIEAMPNQTEVAVVRLRLRENPQAQQPIERFAPRALVTRLHRRGIRTLVDVLEHPELTDDESPDDVARLRAVAKFSVLTPDLTEAQRTHLVSRGYRSPIDIAHTSRAAFIRENHDGLGGDASAAAVYFAAQQAQMVMVHFIGSAWIQSETSPDDEPPDPDIPTGVNDIFNGLKKCGCRDCDSAVSPAAYLAHVLQWTLDHVKDGTASITLAQLTEAFHQPFGELPASCGAVEDQVRQVRLCIEVLWRFTEFLDRGDLQLPTPFRIAYRALRNQLYRAILANLGTSFEQLRRATLQISGDALAAEQVAAQRRTVADILGIDDTHLDALLFDIDQPAASPSEELLQRRFGFKSTKVADVFASLPTPELALWQRERLESIWRSQDWPTDAYSGTAHRPLVDPALIDDSYLRTPLMENAAFALLAARREALAASRQALADQQPQQNGIVALLESELGGSIEQLRSLFGTLRADNPDAAAIVDVHETIATLHVTPAGFTHLMELDAHLDAGEPIGRTQAEIDSAWEAVFDILIGAHRRSLLSTWVTEENEAGILLSPKLFWIPAEPPPPVNPWLGSPSERVEWQDALARRNARPIIDPDQISIDYVILFAVFAGQMLPEAEQPTLTARDLWQKRRDWVDTRRTTLGDAREGLATPLERLQATLNASTTGIGLDRLSELAGREANGISLDPHLVQLNLTFPEYRFVTTIRELALGNGTVTSDTWETLVAILVQVEKRREFAEWTVAEQEAGIILHPHHFVVPQVPQPPDDSPQHQWLHDPVALDAWVSTLHARGDQLRALRDGLAQAVSNAEETVLPLLRNILIDQAVNDNDPLHEKADRLDKRLLIDMRMSGCQMTTRVSQAIETLQRFVRAVSTQDLHSAMEDLELDAEEDYLSAWPVLGSYATWRAFILAYLYPENLLHVSPPPKQSFGFTQLKNKLPSRVEPMDACGAAKEYLKYFQDVCHLVVQASCQVRTHVDSKERCGSTTTVYRALVHVFAVATTSGKVYANRFESYVDSQDTLDTWEPVPNLTDVLEIIGAVPHETPTGQRLLLLFAKVQDVSKATLKFVRFDLDTNTWLKAKELDPPPGAEHDFTAASVQKRHGNIGETFGIAPSNGAQPNVSLPTILGIRAPDGRVYVRYLNAEATGWSGIDWRPLFGDLLAERYKKICALIQRSRDEYLMILQTEDMNLDYRIFSVEPIISRDDGFWRSIAKGEFGGAFFWPKAPVTFVFYHEAGGTRYAVIQNTADFDSDGYIVQSIESLEVWLKTVVGVSLTNFPLNFSYSFDLHVRQGENSPNEPFDTDHRPYEGITSTTFVGSLFQLLTLTTSNWDYDLPAEVIENKADLLRQVQDEGMAIFVSTVQQSKEASFEDKALRQWKLADWYLRQFANGNGLATVVDDAFNSNPAVIRFRGFMTESQMVDDKNKITEQWHFVSSGGDEEFGPNPRKAMALRTPKGAFRLKMERSGDILSAPQLSRITPYGDGPFDIMPLSGKNELELRAPEIQEMYDKTGAQASVRIYLREAFRLVPSYLGNALQRNGHYEEALLWYRQVYDYLQPPNRSKIDYGLRLEETLSLSYENAAEWLNDAGNGHAIAATRKNTYTRHILLMIIRCLIDYADALFSHDNVSDNARARELYTQALKLLELKDLKPGISTCANILGELDIDVTEGLKQQFKTALTHIPNPDHLRSVVETLTASTDGPTNNTIGRLRTMRDAVLTAIHAIPPPPRMAELRKTQQTSITAIEDQALAHQPTRTVLTKAHQRGHEQRLSHLAEVTERSVEELSQVPSELSWLRAPAEQDDRADRPLDLALFDRRESGRLASVKQIKKTLPLTSLTVLESNTFNIGAGVSFHFCIPQNPVVQALRSRAENNLNKLRTCRNIAGFLRQLDPYGAPIGIGSGMVSLDGTIFSGIVDAPPTAYRYGSLISRAKELVGIAQQIETGYQEALVRAENEALTRLQAEQGAELAQARVSLQDLRITQANTELGLAQLQKGNAVLRAETYAGWIDAGPNDFENQMVQAYQDAGAAQEEAAKWQAVGQVASAFMAALPQGDSLLDLALAGPRAGLAGMMAGAAANEGLFNVDAIRAQTSAQVNSTLASFERRNQEWQLQQNLANLDVQIGDQQIALAQNQIAIVQQERVIAGMERTHAVDVLNFLLSKNFTEEMYRWIASVLEDVYRFFLQEATVIARLAERQLAFERQQGQLKVIQADYWNVPVDSNNGGSARSTDRLGLTGSARLLQDIYKLDNYAFETRKRKQTLSLTLDLAAQFPVEFQRFREIGVLVFGTPQVLIDRQMPGYYLCLIQQVTVSVVALIPPTYGIRATLTSSGLSRVVVGGDTFQTVTIRNLPERLALTSASTTSGPITLEPDSQSLLNPFEGTGFDTLWELKMPKATNSFDYNSMATVLFTVNMTALHSFDYEREVIARLDRKVSFDRAFDFRQAFADAWYDLNNPDQTSTPMTVRFETRRNDFPPNLSALTLQHVVLYLVRKDGEVFEQPIRHLRFTPTGMNGTLGGPASTVDGRVSTRSGNGSNWLPMIGQVPYGQWELAFPDLPIDRSARDRFANELIENVLLVLTVSGQTLAFPS